MKLYHLIQKHKWEDIYISLVRLYPDYESELHGFEDVYKKLKSLTPVESDMRLQIDLIYSEHAGEYQFETKSISPKEETTKTVPLFVLEFTPWSKWLGMEVDEHTLEKYAETDIIAHCMYEMTFFGFTQEDIKVAEEKITDSGVTD